MISRSSLPTSVFRPITIAIAFSFTIPVSLSLSLSIPNAVAVVVALPFPFLFALALSFSFSLPLCLPLLSTLRLFGFSLAFFFAATRSFQLLLFFNNCALLGTKLFPDTFALRPTGCCFFNVIFVCFLAKRLLGCRCFLADIVPSNASYPSLYLFRNMFVDNSVNLRLGVFEDTSSINSALE